MTRMLSALVLSLIVVAPTFAQAMVDKPAVAQDTAKPAAPPPTIVQKVRDAIAEPDFKKAEKLVLDDMAANGTTPIAIEAFSWLGRGAVAAKRYDEALAYANRTYAIVEEQLKTRKLDDEARLPIALGAAIEVTALATAGQGGRSDAILYLRRELDTYQGTSIVERLNKNINLLGLEGTPALPIESSEWIGTARASLASLKGKPVVLYLWAHWCGDCKSQAVALARVTAKYKDRGLAVIAPTRLYGSTEKKSENATVEEENAESARVWKELYKGRADVPVVVSEPVMVRYGVSTTPTFALIDRKGIVRLYHPGRLAESELERHIEKLLAR